MLQGRKDLWDKMNQGEKQGFVKSAIRDGIDIVLAGKRNTIEDHVEEVMASSAPHYSWSDWKAKNPTETQWIAQAQRELNEALSIINTAKANGRYDIASQMVDRKNWQFVNKDEIKSFLTGGFNPNPDNTGPVLTTNNQQTGNQQGAASVFDPVIGFVKDNPIPTSVAVIGLAILLFSRRGSNKTQVASQPKTLKTQQLQ